VTQAARATAEIASNITSVAQAAESTSKGIVSNQNEIEGLARVAKGLREQLAGFKTS
jgi:methyl-accepting chemotaxis protein